MRLEQYTQPFVSPFYKAYLEDSASLSSFFHYEWNQEDLNKRLQETDYSKHKRVELAGVITSYMDQFGISEKSRKHIEELKDNGVVVIGGQQAGILTGPMYSIHKAISVIVLAKRQREIQGIPVIPVFWIAGEDHDIDEINHVYIEKSRKLQKLVFPERSKLKKIASETTFTKETMLAYLEEIFKSLPETSHTKKLYSKFTHFVEEHSNFTTFFSAIMNELFYEEGLLMVDAAYQPLRQLESDYFVQMIEQSSDLASLVFQKEQQLDQLGYGSPIQAKETAANLFYVEDGERFLLERESNSFVHEAKGISFTKEELIAIAKDQPEKLSNNVVTRPLMQEMVFPVLSFIGGPGEIAYWATLKDAFQLFNMKMPVITPRLSISLVTPKVQSLLDKLEFSIPDVWSGEVELSKARMIEENQNKDVSLFIQSIKDDLASKYEELDQLLKRNDIKLTSLVEKNLDFHAKQLTFMENAVEDTILTKLDSSIYRYDQLMIQLMPNGGLQERTYSPIQLLNEKGQDLLVELLQVPYEFNGKHHVVSI